MTSRLLTIALVLGVAAGLLFEAGRAALTPEGRWREWLQLLVAQQAADTLQRQVQLGPVSGLSLDGVEARDLAVAEGRLLADGVIARAEVLRLGFDLVGIARGDVAPAAGIGRVQLERAWVHVVRDASGDLNLEGLLPRPVRPAPPEERFRGVVTVTDAIVIYDDYALPTTHGGPLNLELTGIDAEIDARRIGWTALTATAHERLDRFATLALTGESETETGFAWADVRLSGVDVGWWFDALVPTDALTVTGGRAQLAGTIGVPPEHGDEPPSLSAQVSVRGATVRLADLGDRPFEAEMDGFVTLSGVDVQRLEAAGSGLRVEASGLLGDYADPLLDLRFEAEAARADDLLALAPEEAGLTEQLAGLDLSGPVLASGRLDGPVEAVNLSAQVNVPGEVRYADAEFGAVTSRGVELRVDILDLLEPNVRAQATLASVEAGDLTPLRALLPDDLPGELQIAALPNVQADVLWSADRPLAHTELYVPRLAVGDLEVVELRADVALAGDVLRVSDLSAQPLGAELTAEGVVDLSEPGEPWAWARGEIAGLDLARLPELPGLDAAEGLSGAASAVFAGSWQAGEPQVVAQMVVEDGSLARDDTVYGVEHLTAIVALDEAGIVVAGGSFTDPLGTGWVRGVMPFEGDLAGRFAVAGVDLERVRERFGVGPEDLRGQAFVAGDLRGSPQNPQIDATVRGFDLGAGRWSVDGVIAEVSGGAAELHIDDLYASAGRLVVHAGGTLTAPGAPATLAEALAERDHAIDGTVTLAGPMDENALDLAQLQDLDLHGAAHAEIAVGGTLKRPSAQGEVHLGYAHYEAVATDDATLVVSLEGDVLELEELRVPVGEALITGQASITSLYDEPLLAASVSAQDVVLQELAPFQQLDLPISGRVDLPYVSLNGPLDDLKGLAQIQASELMLGDEPLGGVSAVAVLDGDTLQLPTTTMALAGGTMSLAVALRFDEGRVLVLGPAEAGGLPRSQVTLKDVSVPGLLRAGVPLARRFADPPSGGLGDDGGAAGASGEPEPTGAGEPEEGPGRPLSQQLASLALRLDGRLEGTISAEGVIPPAPEPDMPAEEAIHTVLAALPAQMEIVVRDGSVDGRPLPDTMLSADVTEDQAVQVVLESTEGEGLITADGTWRPGGEIDALLDVSALDLAVLRPWIPRAVESIGGRLSLTVQASGSLDNPDLIGSVDILEPEVHGAKFDIVSAPIIRYDGSTLQVVSLVLRERDEEVFVDGTVPFDWASMSVPQDGVLNVSARTENTDLGILPPILADLATEGPGEDSPLAQVKANGTINSEVRIEGTLQRPELSGRMQVRAPAIEMPWLSSPVEDLALDVTLTGAEGKTVVEELRLAARVESTTLEIGGADAPAADPAVAGAEPRYAAELREYDLARMHENEFHLRASVAAPQQSFGQLTARKLRGVMALDTDATGEQVLTITDLGADFGDGSILLDGRVDITSFRPGEFARNAFDLALVAKKARPRYGNLFLGTVDGTIVGRNPAPGEPVVFTGGLTVSHAVVGVPRPSGKSTGELHGLPGGFPAPAFDLALAIGPDVRVQTAGMTAPLQVTDRAVVLQGTPQRPKLQALVEVQEGEASMPGGVLDIETAGVRLLVAPALGARGRTPPVLLRVDGSVWATATRRIETAVIDGRQVGPIDVYLEVSGTLPDNVHVQASSIPPLAEEQIYALVGTAPFAGSQLAEGGNLEDVLSQQFVSALGAAFRLYVFQPFEEELKQLLGLSVLEVSFAFEQPVSVRIDGYLMEDLLITYRTAAIGESEDYDLELSYRVDRRYQVGFATDERSNSRIFVEYVYSF